MTLNIATRGALVKKILHDTMVKCKHTEDGYCIRQENDYCHESECKGTYSIKEVCKHTNKLTQVISTAGTCETTLEVCADCNEQLTEPKTDCA